MMIMTKDGWRRIAYDAIPPPVHGTGYDADPYRDGGELITFGKPKPAPVWGSAWELAITMPHSRPIYNGKRK